jgi:hypothetical protein
MKKYRTHWITDVNKPGTYPEGGWWMVVDGIYTKVAGLFETEAEAIKWIKEKESNLKEGS